MKRQRLFGHDGPAAAAQANHGAAPMSDGGAARKLSKLSREADGLLSRLARLRQNLVDIREVMHDDARARSALTEANEQLVLAALHAESVAETAVSELGALVRSGQRDPLTNLPNRLLMLDRLQNAIAVARRRETRIAVLFIDLDHFKQINDRHGHPAGDRALQRVAEVLRKRLRRTDVVGRVGGEEFAAILPGDDLDQVALVAEEVRKAVEDLPRLEGGGLGSAPTPITLSIGGTSLMPETLDTQVLIDCADQALYDAKRHGRNQVRVCSPP